MKTKKNIELLIDILENSKIDSLEVSSFWGFKKIKLSKRAFLRPHQEFSDITPEINPSEKASIESVSEKNKESVNIPDLNLFIQKAPLVGTVYLNPKPGEPSFIKEGDLIKKGQKICLIEAMKIFNDIEAEEDGIIYEILVKNEDPVEFGQPIIKIKS